MDYKKTGEFLKSLRKANGLTQEDVANHLLVSPKTISRWECGDGLPDINIISDVAELYNITVDEILKGEKNKKELNLKDETINLKNKKRDKTLMNASMKTFNILFLISISILLLFSLIGIIISFFYFIIGIIIILFGIVTSIVLAIIGRRITVDKIKDNEDIISTDIKEKIMNKLFFRILNIIDVICISMGSLLLVTLILVRNPSLDFIFSISLLIAFYLIIRLPLIGKTKPTIKKQSIIADISIGILLIAFFFWLTYSDYNAENRVFYFYYLENYKSLPIERTINISDISFYIILALVIILLILFIRFKKAYLLFIPLCLSILAKIPSVFGLKKALACKNVNFHGISPSITGLILFIIKIILIFVLNKKNN